MWVILWRIVNIQGTRPLEKTDSSLLRSRQLSTASRGQSIRNLSLLNARMSTGLISCRSCAGSHSSVIWGPVVLTRPEGIGQLQFSFSLSPFLLWLLSLGMGYAECVVIYLLPSQHKAPASHCHLLSLEALAFLIYLPPSLGSRIRAMPDDTVFLAVF